MGKHIDWKTYEEALSIAKQEYVHHYNGVRFIEK